MSQTDLLILARQGNVEAIATLMNRKLAPVQVMVEAQLEGSCLLLQLVAHGPLPSRVTLVNFVRRGMDILKVQHITAVQASAWQAGATQPAWIEQLTLDGATSWENAGAAITPSTERRSPQSQAFGVNLAPLAAAASSPQPPPAKDPITLRIPSPAPGPAVLADSQATPPEPAWVETAYPEADYRNWLLGLQSFGWWQRQQVPRLAAFLVYFLNPGEVPLDAVGVVYQGKSCVLLLTDQRLSCLGGTGWQWTVQEYFGVTLSHLSSAHQSAITLLDHGLSIEHPPTGLRAMVRWRSPVQGEIFMMRSGCRVLPLTVQDGRALSGASGAGEPPLPAPGKTEASSPAQGVGSWQSGSGDRLPLWGQGLLLLIPLVLVVMLVVFVF